MRRFIDSLRDLLLPTLALTILATLWMLAKARNGEEDLNRTLAKSAPTALLDKAFRAADAGPSDATAQTDTGPADHR